MKERSDMRKTKMICTVGPSCEDPAVFKEMCLNGLNVARLNFSHGTHEEHKKKIDMIKAVRSELHLPIAILLDTKGPEFRIKTFKDGKIYLNEGDVFTFTTRDTEGDQGIVSVNYNGLADDLETGDRILVNNGLVIFEVTEIEGTEIRCRVITGGELSDRKSMSFPGRHLKQTYLSEQDKADLLFGIENDVDFVAASFVSCKQDVLDIRNFINENGGSEIDIIAKIENRAGVDNLVDICSVCEGIMVARGDLGVEVPFVELPAIQKYISRTCRRLGKRIIIATEMLESMIHNPRPTRAEISDVANAVYDGASAIMLSGESAVGKYPVDAVRTMGEIAEETERHVDYAWIFRTHNYAIRNRVDAISHAACTMATDLDAKAIIVASISGLTIRMVSRFRCPIFILGLASSEKIWYKLALTWGAMPILVEEYPNIEVLKYYALREAKRVLSLETGDTVVITSGSTIGESGKTNTIQIETIV